VEVEVTSSEGVMGAAIVPSGASTGHHEAIELRDGDPNRLGGLGVRRAVRNIRDEIAGALTGHDLCDQASIDARLMELDGTANKSRLGANAILAVSLAAVRAAANSHGLPLWRYLDRSGRATLPMPMVNMISGGLHARGNIEFQDFLIVPVGARSFSEALEMSLQMHRTLGELLSTVGYSTLRADEGGYGPELASNRAALDLLMQAIDRATYQPKKQIAIAIDVAATHFFSPDKGKYCLRSEGRELDSCGMVELLEGWVNEYPIVSIEDGLAEDDWDGWSQLTRQLGDRIQLLGDDLFTTDPERLRRGIADRIANAVLVKMNQIGTITETLNVIEIARAEGFRNVVSARSGETEDSSVADLTVASGAGQIKIGSVCCSERMAKYNQLLRIEESLPDAWSGAPTGPTNKSPNATENAN
jgi:enolase